MNNDWKNAMMSLLENKDKDFFPNAITLKNKNLPEKIYKYRHFKNDYHLMSLKHRTIWMTNPKGFNDPYDSYYRHKYSDLLPTMFKNYDLHLINAQYVSDKLSSEELSILKQTGDLKSALKERIRKEGIDENIVDKGLALLKEELDYAMRNQLDADIDRIRDGIKVCSFATKNNNILMWSHYSDNHKGFCIEYDLSSLKNNNPLLGLLFPVLYSENLFNATPFVEQFIKDPNNYNDFSLLAAIYKSNDWKYEDEWRYVELESYKLDNSVLGFGAQARISPPISSVYMGSQIEPDNEKILYDLASQEGFKLYKMKLDRYRYKIVVDKEADIKQ
jgi:hypothetical protein